ncbi:MAG: FAD-binding protein, partial [Hyphomicrobiales bacterium]
PSYEGLLCGEPVTASFLGVLRDAKGKVILDGVYLRTRAECSSAIMLAVEAGNGSPNGGAYLDMTANRNQPRSGPYFMRFLETCLPSAYRNARQALGKAAAKCEEPWEVRPGAHYLMGGIRTDEHGASAGGDGNGDTDEGIAGLFAAGQAMGGVFGANRLGSTSLTEGAVFGARAGAAAAETARSNGVKTDDAVFAPHIEVVSGRFGQAGDEAAAKLRIDLQRESWNLIGPVRTAERLAKMDGLIEDWTARLERIAVPAYATWNQAFIELEELRNMLETARAVSAAARERDGSLGGHVRLDRGSISAFSQPYSTVVRRDAYGDFTVRRVERERTAFKRLIAYKLQENWRKAQIKLLRLMPPGMQDKNLEKRYRAIMGASGSAPEVTPGAVEGAIGEATKA